MTAFPAKLSKTAIYAGSLPNGRHVIAYQNNAENQGSIVNAMIFPLPAKTLSQENAVDATSDPEFLRRMDSFYTPRARDGFKGGKSRGFVLETFKVGSYEVMISKSATLIQEEILKKDVTKGPSVGNPALLVNPALLTFLETRYPGWPLVVAFWQGSVKAEPLVFEYDPMFKDVFIPGLDAHGTEPHPGMAHRDHVLLYGSRQEGDVPFEGLKLQGRVAELVAKDVQRRVVDGRQLNGDWWLTDHGKIYSTFPPPAAA